MKRYTRRLVCLKHYDTSNRMFGAIPAFPPKRGSPGPLTTAQPKEKCYARLRTRSGGFWTILVINAVVGSDGSPIRPLAVAAADDGWPARDWPAASGCAKRQLCSWAAGCAGPRTALAMGQIESPRPTIKFGAVMARWLDAKRCSRIGRSPRLS